MSADNATDTSSPGVDLPLDWCRRELLEYQDPSLSSLGQVLIQQQHNATPSSPDSELSTNANQNSPIWDQEKLLSNMHQNISYVKGLTVQIFHPVLFFPLLTLNYTRSATIPSHHYSLAKHQVYIAFDVINRLLKFVQQDMQDSFLSLALMSPPGGLVQDQSPISSSSNNRHDQILCFQKSRESLSEVVEYLTRNHSRLSKSLDSDHRFYRDFGAVLRRNCWMLQQGRDMLMDDMYLNYGYSYVGSLFKEVGHARVFQQKNSINGSVWSLAFPKSQNREVRLLLRDSRGRLMGRCDISPFSPTTHRRLPNEPPPESNELPEDFITDLSELAQLDSARYFLFESELWSHIIKEAASLDQAVISDNSVEIDVQSDIRLIIQFTTSHSESFATRYNPSRLESGQSSDLKLAWFQILLRRQLLKHFAECKKRRIDRRASDTLPKLLLPALRQFSHGLLSEKVHKCLLNVLAVLGDQFHLRLSQHHSENAQFSNIYILKVQGEFRISVAIEDSFISVLSSGGRDTMGKPPVHTTLEDLESVLFYEFCRIGLILLSRELTHQMPYLGLLKLGSSFALYNAQDTWVAWVERDMSSGSSFSIHLQLPSASVKRTIPLAFAGDGLSFAQRVSMAALRASFD